MRYEEKARGFRDLRVWQQAIMLAAEVMKIAAALPPHELYGLGNQMRRSAISVSSNIAEGWGRRGEKEFSRFLDIANGSLCELETQLEIAKICYNIDTLPLIDQCVAIRAQIVAFARSLEKNPRIRK